MPKRLSDISFADLLPDSISGDETVQNAAKSLDGEIQAINDLLEVPALYARLDELDERAVDLLAWQYHVDFWEPDLDVDHKRSLVRQSIAWHKYKGTVWAVRQALVMVGFGDAEILEHRSLIQSWMDAGGHFIDGSFDIDGSNTLSASAGEFEFMSTHWAEFGVRANAADIELIPGQQSRIQRLIDVAKPARSHLVGLKFYALYSLLSEIFHKWRSRVIIVYDKCGSSHVPHFQTIGWGCETIGGSYETDSLNGDTNIDGWTDLDGLRPVGKALNDGHLGLWGSSVTMSATRGLGGDKSTFDTLDPNYRYLLEPLDGKRTLSVQTINGDTVLDGSRDLSVRVLTRRTYDMLDGSRNLGMIRGYQGVWHNGYVDYWNGNDHFREAI